MATRLLLAVFQFALLSNARPNSPGECQGRPLFAYEPRVDDFLSARVISNTLTRPRGIKFDSAGNLLVVQSGAGIAALTEVNDTSSCNGWEKRNVVSMQGLNHGIEIVGGFLYASTESTLYRWEYNANEAVVSGEPRVVVSGMSNSDHNTRTLLYQPGDPGYMIINRGSDSNIDIGAADIASGRSQVRRFALNRLNYDWMEGQLLGWGLRNGVALALGRDNRSLWEVENSADEVRYNGVDVHLNNPAEELNLLDLSNTNTSGPFYGYPSCFTVWNMTADIQTQTNLRTGDQFSIETGTERNDAWCQDPSNVARPVLSFMAHSAPLDMRFYSAPSDRQYAINTDWNDDAFISFHGSWNTRPPTGYGVIRVPWSTGTGRPEAESTSGNGYSFILQARDTTRCPSECIRPVGLAFDKRGRLFVSSDSTREIFVVESSDSPDATSSASKIPNISVTVILPAMLVLIIALFNPLD
ncbi:hypothetical protein FRC02_008764 [Tulasnella sp. 418]|nr:hypothetical protein FRC02_008764 [Tulasnella sp. 418]